MYLCLPTPEITQEVAEKTREYRMSESFRHCLNSPVADSALLCCVGCTRIAITAHTKNTHPKLLTSAD